VVNGAWDVLSHTWEYADATLATLDEGDGGIG
jgi:hypothetical protein